MARDERAGAIAERAAALAAGAGVDLPATLRLWALAGRRPTVSTPLVSDDPAADLGHALELALTPQERRRGAHYTPVAVADRVACMALAGSGGPSNRPVVVDPACGGGALLLAAARRLVAGGVPRETVARELLWAADIDPLAVAVTEAAIALWSGGFAPADGHVVVADLLVSGIAAWPSRPAGGFGALVGNPPFQGQLSGVAVRSPAEVADLRARFGAAVTPYVDTAALFLLAGVDLVRDGGRVAMVLPQSVVASRDAGPVRTALAGQTVLHELWAPADSPFGAKVHVCVAALGVRRGGEADDGDAESRLRHRRGRGGRAADRLDGDRDGPHRLADAQGAADWASHLANARGVPEVDLGSAMRTVGDLATAVAGFRAEYYGLVPHVVEVDGEPDAALITCGLIDVGASAWGQRPVRFAKASWRRPGVDLPELRAANPQLGAWVDRLRRPKVLVASQTRLIEAAVDHGGTWVPSTPVVSVLPHEPADVDRIAAVLCAPPVSAWALRRAAGTALSRDAIRVSAALVLAAPLPNDGAAWADAACALGEGDLDRYGATATAMYRLPEASAAEVLTWWQGRRPG